MLKIMGVFFWGENFHHKRKRWTQLGSHIVIKPLDVSLVFFSLHGLILITRAIQEKVFHEEAFNLCLPIIALFFGKERIWDFSKASWFLLGSGVEVLGLAPTTPPTPGFKTFCDPRGVCKGNHALYFGERSIFRFLC
jgi:hypothetical protein